MLFNERIAGKDDWSKLFLSIEAFLPLIRHIFAENALPFSRIENCTPGTNAVFAVGNYIIKIFAPPESGFGNGEDYITERFGIKRANQLGICAPKLAAAGSILDSYRFDYLVMERVFGREISDLRENLNNRDKLEIGGQLREFTALMDGSCENFNSHKLRSADAEERWLAFPEGFRQEREEYIKTAVYSEACYIHGDLTGENLLFDGEKIAVIDYADALIAPYELELACIICEGFRFDRSFIEGYLGGQYNIKALAEECIGGLLLHDFGAFIIRERICEPETLYGIAALRSAIMDKLE